MPSRPWMTWAMEAERHAMLVPKEGAPVYEGLRVAMPRALNRAVLDYAFTDADFYRSPDMIPDVAAAVVGVWDMRREPRGMRSARNELACGD